MIPATDQRHRWHAAWRTFDHFRTVATRQELSPSTGAAQDAAPTSVAIRVKTTAPIICRNMWKPSVRFTAPDAARISIDSGRPTESRAIGKADHHVKPSLEPRTIAFSMQVDSLTIQLLARKSQPGHAAPTIGVSATVSCGRFHFVASQRCLIDALHNREEFKNVAAHCAQRLALRACPPLALFNIARTVHRDVIAMACRLRQYARPAIRLAGVLHVEGGPFHNRRVDSPAHTGRHTPDACASPAEDPTGRSG
jgi:hypothetical protein